MPEPPSEKIPRATFDSAPPLVRLLSAALIVAIGMMLAQTIPAIRWAIPVSFALGILLIFFQQRLVLDFDLRMWQYSRGIWPVVVRSFGSFDGLYGIEITKSQREIRDSETPGLYASTYSARLHWAEEGSLAPMLVFSGRSFNLAAYPAVRLAKDIGIPILLGRDMHSYDHQLAEVQVAVQHGDEDPMPMPNVW